MGKKKKNKGGGGGAGAAAAGQGSTASVMPRRNRLSATRGPRVAAELTALHQKKDWKGVAMEEDQAELIFPAQQCTKMMESESKSPTDCVDHGANIVTTS